MRDKFPDVADPTFTARMEERLDQVETGEENWVGILDSFYGDFESNLKKVESELDGTRLKVPDEVSEEVCPQCGKQLVVKSGRFGRFLACPGWPECDFTMPLVVEMPGKCPRCGGRILKRTGRSKKNGKQYTFYCCEHRSEKDEAKRCEFITWDVPVKDNCPVCGQTMFKTAGKGAHKPFCINEQCSNFTPEEKRGGYRRRADSQGEEKTEKTAGKKSAAKKAPAKKTTAKKPAAKKTATTKKTAAKKTTAKKTTAKQAKES